MDFISARKKRIILMILLFSIPLSGMGIDIYVPSLPALKVFFNEPHSLITLTVSLYLLGFSIGQAFFGPASDSMGRKNILFGGMILFSIFSLLATLTSTVHELLLMRFLQGLAVTAPVVVTKAIVTDLFDKETIKKASTYLVLAWSIGPIIAPAIGGHLQQYFGWRGGFYFLFVYGLILSIFIAIYLSETNQYKQLFKLTAA